MIAVIIQENSTTAFFVNIFFIYILLKIIDNTLIFVRVASTKIENIMGGTTMGVSMRSYSRYSISFDVLLEKIGGSGLPESVLIGALLDVTSQYNRTSQQVEKWARVGESFLKGVA